MSQPPPPHGNWNVPAPPPPPRRPVRGARVAAGVGVALLGHVLTVVATFVVGSLYRSSTGNAVTYVLVGGQLVLFLGCLVVGVLLITRDEPGFGVGLLIGWVVGVVAAPVIGFAACVIALSQMGS